jgi:hypothetical protein
MKTNKILVVLVAIFLCASLTLSAAPKKIIKKYARLEFNKGETYLTPQIGVNTYAIPFGANIEFALTENIGVGGTVMAWIWGAGTLIVPEVDAAYHFTKLKVEKLDLFAGVGVGFAIWHAKGIYGGTGGSGLYIDPFVAGRYWFSEKMAVSLRMNFGIGDWNGVGGLLGVTFRI